MPSTLNLIIDMIGFRGDDMRVAVFVENIIYAAKRLLYDVTGDHTNLLINEYLAELDIPPDVYNAAFVLSMRGVRELLNSLVIYDIINENIYAVDVTRNQIVLNAYSFFIENTKTSTETHIL